MKMLCYNALTNRYENDEISIAGKTFTRRWNDRVFDLIEENFCAQEASEMTDEELCNPDAWNVNMDGVTAQ